MEKIKILAVDDELAVLNTIHALCAGHHLETETAPFKAIERIYNDEFDIFFVDYNMPYTNGIELLEKIKKLYGYRKHVSIFCPAYGTTYLFEKETNHK